MTKQEILQELRKTFRSVEFPSRIDFEIEQNTLIVKMYKTGILANMQEDNSAFEGWILVIMAFFNKEEGKINWVEFSWETTNEIEKRLGHYHRFLYRVIKFAGSFSWFKVLDSKNIEEKESFTKQYFSGNANLFLNYPKTVAREVPESNTEANLERKFKKNPALKQKFQLECIDHQLPVGVFNDFVGGKNHFFTGGKSAIDLWGITGKELFIFELKYNNRKVGVISEILLYLWIMEDLCIKKKINYPVVPKKELERKIRSFDKIYKKANEVAGIIKINGVLLADEFHPLVNEDLISFVNKHFTEFDRPFEIQKQQYSYDSEATQLL